MSAFPIPHMCIQSLTCPAYQVAEKEAADASQLYHNDPNVLRDDLKLLFKVQLIKLDSYWNLYRHCTCCKCHHRCQPCFNQIVKDDMKVLLRYVIRRETNFRQRMVWQEDLAELERNNSLYRRLVIPINSAHYNQIFTNCHLCQYRIH